MKLLKKLPFVFSSLLIVIWTKVLAQGNSALDRVNRAAGEANLPSTEASPQRIIINFINYALTLVGLFFLISIIYAGWQWLSSGGEEDKINEAKKRLRNSIIGIVIIASSLLIVVYVNKVVKCSTEGGYYCPALKGNPSGQCSNNLGCLRDFGSDWICANNSCVYEGACNNDNDCVTRYGAGYQCKQGPIKKECARD